MKKYQVWNGFHFDDEDDFGVDSDRAFSTLEEAKEKARKQASRHGTAFVVIEAVYKVKPEEKQIDLVEEEIV